MGPSLRSYRRWALTLASPALIAACATLAPSERPLPLGAVSLVAPAIYRDWHQKTEACSGLAGSFSALEWYVVPGVNTFSTPEGPQVGMWALRGGTSRIIVAGNYSEHEMVIRHEMLHALLGRTGHPSEFFVTRCHLTWDSWDAAGAESHPPTG